MGRRRQAINKYIKYQTGISAKVSINQGNVLEAERYFILAGQVFTEVVKFKLSLH